MKQIIAFSILFCLVFLNVPRTFVHDCDHDEHSHQHSSESNQGLSIDQDECFVCEFDLDIAEIPTPFNREMFKRDNSAFVVQQASQFVREEFDLFSLRGPPHFA